MVEAGSAADVLTDDLRTDLVALYRLLHASPELSMSEHATAALVRDRMSALGFEVFPCGGTGVVAVLRNGEHPVVAFRAELDGLPVREETGADYASRARAALPDGTEVPLMHACGHDLHIACAIGAAAVLARSRERWEGTLVMVFQPGEETGQGALAMLDDGLWDRAPLPEVIFAQHVVPGAAGTVQVPADVAMAAADTWQVTIHGAGGHGSRPEDALDPVVLMAHTIVRLQSVVSREVGAREAAVVTVGTVRAGTTPNVIPSTAEFTLNIRTLDDEVRTRLLAALLRVIRAEALASGAPEPEIVEVNRFPLLRNDAAAAASVLEALRADLGADEVTPVPPLMGSEDFGRLGAGRGIPAVYWFIGGAPAIPAEGQPPANHSPRFLPELDTTLTTGVLAALAALRSRLRVVGSSTTEGDL